ncbi:unnamed protein product [Gongylonema pulchrum]|uniref:PHTB1_N domain-containing protein n=1 Tax=Gongylonema pulchrum TaxID=637853 RepID=A0A183ESJ4_9BILA|nr:unnamed protein product [Gongylonema pulchrum]
MLVILSHSRISVSYLGTAPSLFRLPASQTRFIDFEQRHKEMMEYESIIRKKPAESVEGLLTSSYEIQLLKFSSLALYIFRHNY